MSDIKPTEYQTKGEALRKMPLPSFRWQVTSSHHEAVYFLTSEQARSWAQELLRMSREAEEVFGLEEAARDSQDFG